MHLNYYQSLVFHWLDNIQRPAHVPEWPAVLPEPTPEIVKKLAESGTLCVGDPDDCSRTIQMYEDIGADQLVFSQLSTTMGYARAVESLHLFGKEVLPKFDKDPVHRSTRMRERAMTADPV